MDQPPTSNLQRPSEVEATWNPLIEFTEDQERDIWWGAYAGRTMVPSFLLCLLVTLLLTGVMVFLGVTEAPPSEPIRYAAYTFVGAIWSLQLLCWAYRITVWTYRLTNRRLFREWSFWRSPNRAMELHQMADVAVERSAWHRWLGIGRVRIVSPTDTWILEGIRHPDEVAATIRAWVQRVQRSSPE